MPAGTAIIEPGALNWALVAGVAAVLPAREQMCFSDEFSDEFSELQRSDDYAGMGSPGRRGARFFDCVWNVESTPG